MQDYKMDLEKIQEKANNNRIQKAKLTERLSQYQIELEDLRKQLQNYNVSEENLSQWLEDEKKQIEMEIEECRKILKIA